VREGTEEPEDVQQPKHHSDHNDAVEDGLDGGLHGNKAVHKPEQNPNDNQNHDDVDEGHRHLLERKTGPRKK